MQRQPQVEEMVSFLKARAPLALETIRREQPAFSDLLKEGAILGVSDNLEELKARATICFKATEEILKICDEQIPSLKERLKGSQRVQLYGQIVTAISGASVVTSLATDYKTITYIAGGLTMIGSLVPIIVNYQRTGLDEDKKLDKTYVQLIKFKVEARRNQSQLKFFMDHNFNVDGISEVINRCNELCAEMEELLLLS